MIISCVAIDDDSFALENLKNHIKDIPELTLTKTFTDPLQALGELSRGEQIGILFMDIQMHPINGIELAGLLRKKTKHLIFTTAFSKYAINAFNVDADAYLLKPYSKATLLKAISQLYPPPLNLSNFKILNDDHFFYLELEEEFTLVKIMLKDVVWIENIDNRLYFKTEKGIYKSDSLNFIQLMKSPETLNWFLQISKSKAISKQHIKKILIKDKILMSNETIISVEISYKQNLHFYIKEHLLNNKERKLRDDK